MKTFYLGAFPPGWGGVTIKNRDLYNALVRKGLDIVQVDLHKITRQHDVHHIFRFLCALINPFSSLIVGISAKSRRKFTHLLYLINRSAMRKSVLIIMGGTAANELENDPAYVKWMSEYKTIYAETFTMMKKMCHLGLHNVKIYPNGRFRPHKDHSIVSHSGPLKCVFFSDIHPMKGIYHILDVAEELSNVDFSFYGTLYNDYEVSFLDRVESLPNVSYKGNFIGSNEQVYNELSQYDVLLFPTKYKTEGVPGIFVEAKIAGLAIIASNESFNAELVANGKEGIILEVNDSPHLAHAISNLDQDRELLSVLREGSQVSAEKYFIENYIEEIMLNFSFDFV